MKLHHHPRLARRFLLLSGLAVGIAPAGAQSVSAAAQVEVATPRRGSIHRFITLPGSLRADQQVTLHAKVAGYLKSIAVDRGDAVKAGQLLAELELPEIVAERARHEAELKIARVESERLTAARAKAPDLITPAATDAAEARLAMAQAALVQNDTLMQFARITAPFDGIVTDRFVDVGAFVPAATAGSNPAAAAIVTVMDYSTVRARVAVPEIEAARIRVGQPVEMTIEALPGRSFQGKVSRTSGALDEVTRSLVIEADFPNPDLTLRPGMYAILRIGVEQHRDVLVVPAAALVREKTAAFLFTLVDGKANRVPVKAGFNDGRQVEIQEGVAEDARVLIPGKIPLVHGQPVNAMESK